MSLRASAKNVPAWVWAVIAITFPLLLHSLLQWSPGPKSLVGVNDPDAWLRLTLVREWLLGGGWYDHEVLRSNAPYGGISSPWTRPLDLVIAALVKLQFFGNDLNVELMRASLLLPPIWAALMALGLCRIMKQLNAPASGYFMLVAVLAMAPGVWNYFAPGNADHHAPLAVLWTWAISLSLTSKPQWREAIWLGAILAMMMWISPESQLLIAILYAWHGLNWLHKGNARFLAHTATVTAYGVLLAVMIERAPTAWVTPIYDSISVVHVLILALCALLGWILFFMHKRALPEKLGIVTAGAVGLFGIIALTYPLAFKGLTAEVDPFIIHSFLPNIIEAQPLLHGTPLQWLPPLIQPLFALYVAWRLRKRPEYAQLMFLGSATLALFLLQVRWQYYIYPPVIVVLAPWLAALFTPNAKQVKGAWPATWLKGLSEKEQAVRRMPVVLAIILLPLVLAAMNPMYASNEEKYADKCMTDARRLIQKGALSNLSPRTFLIHTNLGTELLFFTPHRIVASNYHREGDAIGYVWGAKHLTTLEALRRYLAIRDIGAVLVCPEADTPENSILLRLRNKATQPPWWLERVEFPQVKQGRHKPAIFLVKP